MTSALLDVLLANLDAAYDRRGWHGPTLRAALRGITAAEAVARPAGGRHSIWELAAHAAYWKHMARRRLTGVRSSFPLKGSNWFASPGKADEAGWRGVLRVLDDEHRTLRETIAAMDERALRDAKKQRLAYGVAAHDLYHTGQIQLLKRMLRD